MYAYGGQQLEQYGWERLSCSHWHACQPHLSHLMALLDAWRQNGLADLADDQLVLTPAGRF